MSKLPDILPGHWDTPDGAEMARRYAPMERRKLFGGQFTDMAVAHATAMICRNDADFEASLAVARDRIRWLSVQLAIANFKAEDMRKRVADLREQAKACAHDPTGDSYSYDTQADLLEEFL